MDIVFSKLEGIRAGGGAALTIRGRAGEDMQNAANQAAANETSQQAAVAAIEHARQEAAAAKTAEKEAAAAPLGPGQKLVQSAAKIHEKRQRQEMLLKRIAVEGSLNAKEHSARALELTAKTHCVSMQAVQALNGIQLLMGAQIVLEHKKARVDVDPDVISAQNKYVPECVAVCPSCASSCLLTRTY